MAHQLYDIQNGKLSLNFHWGQQRAYDSDKRIIFVFAGTQGGKTSFVPWWLAREIGYLADPRGIGGKGQGDYLVATSSYDLFKLKLLPEVRKVFEDVLKVGRFWAGDKIIELKDPATGRFWAKRSDDQMWGRIILRSASAEGGLESATAKAACLDEVGQDDFRIDSWRAVLRRLSLSQGRVLGTTTIYNMGWCKTEVFDRWETGDPDYDVVQFPSIANPIFPVEEFARAKNTLPEWMFDTMYKGLFSRPSSLIYRDFDRRHVLKIEPDKVPPEWERYCGFDFGPIHTSAVWIAKDPIFGSLLVYREYLEGGFTTGEHVHNIKTLTGQEKITAYFGGAPSEHQYRWDWAAAGIPVLPPVVSDVESGITRVTETIKTGHFYVTEDAGRLRDEFGKYSRVLDSMGQPTEDIKDKSKYHMLDALRYGVLGAVLRGAVGVMY
jgi:hypothetical protein